ncbi:hypothetical protein DI273_07235 [Streptomyces violascens]|nr:hypothetical protein DI273_07235 [Streptomyces violascens]
MKATESGTWRWTYHGNSTSRARSSRGDHVALRWSGRAGRGNRAREQECPLHRVHTPATPGAPPVEPRPDPEAPRHLIGPVRSAPARQGVRNRPTAPEPVSTARR